MPLLTAGTAAPDFQLPRSDGGTFQLSDHVGSHVVLWWFPKAGSAGCSLQAAGVERLASSLSERGDVVFAGISADSSEDNALFCTSSAPHSLMLTDADGSVATTYGAVREPGDERTGPRRTTYVIEPDGRVAAAFHVVDIGGHADLVAHALGLHGSDAVSAPQAGGVA